MTRRRLRASEVARRRKRRVNPWVHLVLLALALTVVLSFYDRIADGAAGCYSQMSADPEAAPLLEPAIDVTDPPTDSDAPVGPSFRVEIRKADTMDANATRD